MKKNSKAIREFVAALQGLHDAAGRPSTRKLAERTGMSHATVAAALNGSYVPTWPMVASIVRELGGSEAAFRDLWAAAVNISGLTRQQLEERGLVPARHTLKALECDRPPSAEAVAVALRNFRSQTVAAGQAKQALDRAIADAAHAGVQQVEITRVTGYSRERIRQICRMVEERRRREEGQ